MQFLSRMILAAVLLFAVPAAAIPLADGAAQAPADDPAIVDRDIAQTVDEGDDARIAKRLQSIFEQFPEFEGVRIIVSEGVVTLAGTVPDREAVTRGQEIASRVDGVVAVQNGLERDLSVEQNLSVFGQISDSATGFVSALPLFGLAALVAIAVGVLGYLIAGMDFLWNRFAPNAFLRDLIRSAIRFAFVIGGLILALDIIGAGALLGAVLGGAGIIGLAMGFALRDTVENYVSSVMLSIRQPFRANDHVLIDDKEGRVIRLTSRATILMTLEGNHLRIPNSQVFKAVILNFSTNPLRRFDFEMGIDADDDPNAARKLGRETLAALSFVQNDPPPEAHTEAVGDSNIVIRFIGWVDQREADWNRARSRAIAAIKSALEENGFGLPEPIYRLRFDGRTDPLPFANVDAKDIKSAKAKPKKSANIRPQESDAEGAENVAPSDEIARMVETERDECEDASDLLDQSRPVE